MVDEERPTPAEEPADQEQPKPRARRRTTTTRGTLTPKAESAEQAPPAGDAEATPAAKTTRRRRPRKAEEPEAAPVEAAESTPAETEEAAPKHTTRRRRTTVKAEATEPVAETPAEPEEPAPKRPTRRRRTAKPAEVEEPHAEAPQASEPEAVSTEATGTTPDEGAASEADSEDGAAPPARRRRRGHRGGVGRRRQSAEQAVAGIPPVPEPDEEEEQESETPAGRRRRGRRQRPQSLGDIDATPSQTKDLSFMHPSEREFANLLDYYHIKYLYEPRSFPLRWEGNRVVEMHTPDFYLPEYDQYFELTTMKQNLVTQKNRKLRHVKEMYPEINIQLLYRRDLMRLMGKYGFGPLAEVEVAGTERVLFSTEQVQQRVKEIGAQIAKDYAGQEPILVGVLRGVVVFMADLMRNVDLPLQIEFMEISHYGEEREEAIEVLRDVTTDLRGRPVIVVEDIVDTGLTLSYLMEHLKAKRPSSIEICALLDKSVRRMAQVDLKYVGFEIPDEFVIGYGLDYGGRYRNLPYIGVLKPQEPKAVAQR